MKLARLIEGLDIISISGKRHEDVSSVCYAANQCVENSLFVAVRGLQKDGHDFINEAVSRGATVIVYEKDLEIPAGVTGIKVSESRRALGVVSRNYFGDPSAKMVLIAVTGTNGKTTISYLLESILKEAGFPCGVLGTVNYRYNDKTYPAPNTTPESYELQKILRAMADDGVTHVAAEVSSHAVDLKRVDDCDFDIGIFTNLTRDHLDYHITMENYYQAKKRFFAEILPRGQKTYPQKMVINADDEWGQRILKEVPVPALTYGMEGDSSIKILEYKLKLSGIDALVSVAGEAVSIASPLIGKFNLYNILAALGAALILKIPLPVIQKGISRLSNVPGRLERVTPSGGLNVFVDYAHTDDALKRVLQNLTELKEKKIISVFGCGGNRDRGKRPLMGEAAATLSDLTIVTSDNPRMEDPLAIISEIEAGIDGCTIKKIRTDDWQSGHGVRSYAVIPDRRTAIEAAIDAAQSGDIVLIAGKGHEDYQILGTEKIWFDDRVIVKQILESKKRTGNG